MDIKMKTIFLQGLKRRLFTRMPVLAVLLLTAVVAACAGPKSSDSTSPPSTTTPPPMTTANCMFAEDNGTQDCGLIVLPQVFNSNTTYNITVGEVLAGQEVNTDKIGVSNFNFTQIIQGDTLNHPVNFNQTQKQLTLLANATAVNITIIDITPNLFGEFYIDLDLVLVNNSKTTVKVKVRYTISITPVNDAPVFSLPSYSFADIPFNSTTGYSVGNVSTTDIDNDTISYSISGETNVTNLFQISSTGEITLKKVAVNPGNAPIPYAFNVTASDGNDGSVTTEITVMVLTDNQAPVFRAVRGSGQFTEANETTATPANYNFADIPHNSLINRLVGNVSTTDDDGDTVTYNISGGDDDIALFNISSTGEITLRAIAANPGTSPIPYAFNVTASDGKGESATATISVAVLPNLAPVFEASSYTFANISLPSSLSAGHSVGNVSATDPDGLVGAPPVSYSISGEADDIALFNISSTGEITLIAMAVNSVEHQFNVIASDSEGASTTATISVTVGDLTPPVFTRTPYNFDLSLAMANAAGVVVGNISAMDEDGTAFDYSLEAHDLFQLASAKNGDGSINITLLEPATLSDFAASSITFQVVATHRVGGTSSEPANITVNLINDLQPNDDFDGDGVMGLYDAFPHDGAESVTGNGAAGTPYIISNIYQLQAIAGVDHTGTALGSSGFTNNGFLYGTTAADQLTKHYKLNQNIDASNTTDNAFWAKSAVGSNDFIGHGWTPIAGGENQVFSGSFAGEGYHIHNLNMDLQVANNKDTFGLFGTNGGNISAVGLTNINMQIAAINGSFINDTSLAGNGETDSYTLGSGALVGTNNEGGSIKYAYSTGIVNVEGLYTGGLVGVNIGNITYSYSGVSVTGRRYTGGLVGVFGVPVTTSAEVASSYATGNVTATGDTVAIRAGGLVGGLAQENSMHSAKISASYAGNNGDNDVVSVKGGNNERAGPLIGTYFNGYHLDVSYSHWTNSTTEADGGNELVFHSAHSGLGTFTLLPVGRDNRYLLLTQLENTPLNGDGGAIFTSPHWDPNFDDPGIERGWIFEDGEFPALYANRTLSSVTTSLMPPLEAQVCHRRQASDVCGIYDAAE